MKVSVIIPVYNCEKYVGECIESVQNQTLGDIEIICVNDASTDTSSKILEQYARNDKRIRIVNNQENGGLSFARNRGMKYAKGEYIYFLDSDDTIVSSALEELYERAHRLNTDIIFFDSEMSIVDVKIAGDKRLFCSRIDYGKDKVYNGIEIANKMQSANDYRVPVWLQFWKRRFIEEKQLYFFDRLIYEDELFTYMALMQAERVACIKKTYHMYRRHEDTITMRKIKPINIKSMLIIIQEISAYWYANLDKGINSISYKIICGLEWQINEFLKKMTETVDELQQLWEVDSIYSHYLNIIYKPEDNIGQSENVQIQSSWMFTERDLIYMARASKLYIYGAGSVAARYICYLKEIGILFDGVIVSNKEDNPVQIENIKVFGIDEISKHDNNVVLIGVGKRYMPEVVNMLNEHGLMNYIIAGK